MQWYIKFLICDRTIKIVISLPLQYPNFIDINECDEETDECEEHCYNSIGSYYCNCTGPGYRLHSDGNTCESEYTGQLSTKPLQSNFSYCNVCMQTSMNVLRALMIALRSVQTLMGVMSAPALLAISY